MAQSLRGAHRCGEAKFCAVLGLLVIPTVPRFSSRAGNLGGQTAENKRYVSTLHGRCTRKYHPPPKIPV
jgi:hypothetical protein